MAREKTLHDDPMPGAVLPQFNDKLGNSFARCAPNPYTLCITPFADALQASRNAEESQIVDSWVATFVACAGRAR